MNPQTAHAAVLQHLEAGSTAVDAARCPAWLGTAAQSYERWRQECHLEARTVAQEAAQVHALIAELSSLAEGWPLR